MPCWCGFTTRSNRTVLMPHLSITFRLLTQHTYTHAYIYVYIYASIKILLFLTFEHTNTPTHHTYTHSIFISNTQSGQVLCALIHKHRPQLITEDIIKSTDKTACIAAASILYTQYNHTNPHRNSNTYTSTLIHNPHYFFRLSLIYIYIYIYFVIEIFF